MLSKFLSSGLGKIFTGHISVQITSILQTILITRILGPQGKGDFTLIIIYPTIIAGFSLLGLYTGIVKISAKKNLYEKYNIEKTVLTATFITGFLGTVISIVICPIILKDTNSNIIFLAQLFSLFIFANNIGRGFIAIDHGQKNYIRYSITRAILNPIFLLFVTILFISDKINLTNIIFFLLISNCIVSIIRIWLGISRYKKNTPKFPIPSLFKYSIKFSFSDFAEPIYIYYDKVIVALVLSTYDLGIYTTAYTAAAMVSILSTVYATKIFSDIASGGGIEQTIYSIRQNIILTFLSALIIICILPITIPMVFGEDFTPAVLPASILLITCCLQGQSMIIERSILAKGYPFIGIFAKIIAMISFALLSFIFYYLNHINIYTIVLISIITQFIYLLYMTYQMRKIFRTNLSIIPSWKDVKKLFLIVLH
ncbi:oligosaccharide flippase family protein [Dysgonomonas sp.]